MSTTTPAWRRTWYVRWHQRRWAVRRQDAGRAESLHDSKEAALARAIDLAERAGGRVRVKAQNGRIEHEYDFTAPRDP